jgi:hypothetical protein
VGSSRHFIQLLDYFIRTAPLNGELVLSLVVLVIAGLLLSQEHPVVGMAWVARDP